MRMRRAALAVLALSLLVSARAGAAATAAPTMTAASSVAGQPLGHALADGSWQLKNGVWSATVHSVSLPAGSTVVRSSWTTPVVLGKPGQVWFATSFSVTHEGQSNSSSSYFQRVRICYPGGRCERWFSDQSDALPQEYDPAALPFTVTFGHGVALGWGAHPRRAYAQWQFVQTQSGVDEQTDAVEAAVGPKAHTVQPN